MNKFLQLVLNHPVGRYTLLLVLGLLAGVFAYRSMAERPLWAYFTLVVIGLVPLALSSPIAGSLICTGSLLS